jgi:hypothetical protein
VGRSKRYEIDLSAANALSDLDAESPRLKALLAAGLLNNDVVKEPRREKLSPH